MNFYNLFEYIVIIIYWIYKMISKNKHCIVITQIFIVIVIL
jgi:hypothetical protein